MGYATANIFIKYFRRTSCNCDRILRFVILKSNHKGSTDFLQHVANKAKLLAGKTKCHKME